MFNNLVKIYIIQYCMKNVAPHAESQTGLPHRDTNT